MTAVTETKVLNQPSRRVMTLEEWRAEAKIRFGDNSRLWAFKCARCGGIQTVQDFIDSGSTEKEAHSRAHFSCIGRQVKGRGCDWSLGGLFRIHTLEVKTPEGELVPVFEFAPSAALCRFHEVCEIKRTCHHAQPHTCDGERPRGYCPECAPVSEVRP